ncbi:MAG: hypothetical protein COB65_12360 [Thalassobium sp.]|nr:MAG: hypothetical protein COB65_12360 [Thalassobium sp.]
MSDDCNSQQLGKDSSGPSSRNCRGVPPFLGYGTHCLPIDQTALLVQTALGSLGYRHIDTAQSYKNEVQVGVGLRASGVPRDQIYLTTKLSPKHMNTVADVEAAFTRSLQQLGVDYVDCYMVHWPAAGKLPPGDPTQVDKRAACWQRLAQFQQEGKIRHLAVSNFNVHHLKSLPAPRPSFNQLELHPWCHQADVVAYCREHGIGVQAYSPLGRGDPALLNHPLLQTTLIQTKNTNKSSDGASPSQSTSTPASTLLESSSNESRATAAAGSGSAAPSGSSSFDLLMQLNFSMGYDSYLVRSTNIGHMAANWQCGQRWLARPATPGQEAPPVANTSRPLTISTLTPEVAEGAATATADTGRGKRPRNDHATVGDDCSSSATAFSVPFGELKVLSAQLYRARWNPDGDDGTAEVPPSGSSVDVVDKHYCWFSSVVLH